MRLHSMLGLCAIALGAGFTVVSLAFLAVYLIAGDINNARVVGGIALVSFSVFVVALWGPARSE